MAKLIRDKEIFVKKKRGKPKTRNPVNDTEYNDSLSALLLGGVVKLIGSRGLKEIIDSLSDLYDALDEVADFRRVNRSAIAEARKKKAEERGLFKKRIILEEE